MVVSSLFMKWSTVHCTLYTVHCTLYTVHCTLYTVHWTLDTVHCTLYTVHCTLYTVHCTLNTVYCTLYTPTAHFILNKNTEHWSWQFAQIYRTVKPLELLVITWILQKPDMFGNAVVSKLKSKETPRSEQHFLKYNILKNAESDCVVQIHEHLEGFVKCVLCS